MIGKITSEMVSRRWALSLLGALGFVAAPTVLRPSNAEAQTAGAAPGRRKKHWCVCSFPTHPMRPTPMLDRPGVVWCLAPDGRALRGCFQPLAINRSLPNRKMHICYYLPRIKTFQSNNYVQTRWDRSRVNPDPFCDLVARPVQHGGGVELDPCSSDPNAVSASH